jgi:hypothetical protein
MPILFSQFVPSFSSSSELFRCTCTGACAAEADAAADAGARGRLGAGGRGIAGSTCGGVAVGGFGAMG